MRIITDYPWYFFLFCLLAGAAYAIVLYWLPRRREHLRSDIWLSLLRFASITLVAFLLMSPLIKRQHNVKERPIIILAQDNSQSILLGKDSTFYRTEYASNVEQMIKRLEKDYDVQCYTYGETTMPARQTDYSGQHTDIANAIEYTRQQYFNRNVGAMILTGDGIYNDGRSPLSISGMPYPIYTIALGDTTRLRDAAIVNVRFNRIAYMGNSFPVEVTLRTTALKGQRQRLSVTHKGKEIFSETIDSENDEYSTTIDFTIAAEEAGVQSYNVTLSAAEGEHSLRNNSRTFSIEIIDGHEKIAILAATPHPDIAALRNSLETNQNYSIDVLIGNKIGQHEWNKDYDLLILHNLPHKTLPTNINTDKVPTITIVGSGTNLLQFNSHHYGVEVISSIDKQTEAAAAYNKTFSLFMVDEALTTTIERMPPLNTPFGDYRIAANGTTMFYANIGGIISDQPLIAFAQQNGIRHTLIMGDGLWRWRMHDYLDNGSHSTFDELINKIVIYTSLQTSRERLRTTSKSLFSVGEQVVIDAELYNDNFEPTNQPDVELTIGDAQYQFARRGNGYRINLGTLDTGNYTYTASTTYNGIRYNAKGSFAVENFNLEETTLRANHSLMATIAANNGGTMLHADQLDELLQLLKERNDVKPVIYSHTSYTDILNLPLLFIIITVLLTAEWVIRKYNGTL